LIIMHTKGVCQAMAEFKRDRRRDSEYRKRSAVFDVLPAIDVIKSIKELRSIYKNLDDKTFSHWYEHRYHIEASVVLSVLSKDEKTDTIA
jgi:hypothetical protein